MGVVGTGLELRT